jgi:hypothetical protein
VVARVAIVAASLAISAVAATPARAQEPADEGTTTTTTPTATTPTAEQPHLDLVSQTPFVAPTDVLRIGLDVEGAPEGAELTFAMHLSVQTARDGDTRTAQARYDDFVAGKPDTTTRLFNSPKTFALANLPGYGSGTVEAAFEIVPLEVAPPLVGFQISDAGVYPFTIELRAPDGGPVLDSLTTYLVRLPARTETAPALAVAPLAELRAPIALAPDGARSIDPTALDRIHDLIETLADRPDAALTIGATPETLEALIATPTVPATATSPATTGPDLISRLRRALAGRSVLGSTYVDLDVSAWTASGMGDPLAYQRSHGVNVTEAVLAGAASIDERTWRADPSLTSAGLAELHELGVDQVVLDDAVVGPFDPKALPDAARSQVAQNQPFDVEDASGQRVRAVAADDSFGRRLTSTDDEELNAQILVADLAVTYFGASNPRVNDIPDTARGVTFDVPGDELAARSLAPFLTALSTTPPPDGDGVAIIAPATLSTLLALPPATVDGGVPALRTFTPDTSSGAPADMGDYPEHLDDAEFAVSAYESMVLDTGPERIVALRQLLDVSGAAELDPEQRQEYLDAASATADAALAGVRIPEQDSITLTATEYEIPIFLENDLTYPVAVRLELESTKLSFPDGQELDVQLEPGSNRVPVRVKTVSGGTFPLDLTVTTPDKRVTIGEQVIEMRSTAVSGLGLALTIGAGFFLLVWWARNWRKTRRTAIADARNDDGGDDVGDGDRELGDRDPGDRDRGIDGRGSDRGARFTVGPLADLDDTEPAGSAASDAPVGAGPGGVPPEPHQ